MLSAEAESDGRILTYSFVVTEWRSGALTVAGQWRIFTAFPNILAIAELNCSAREQGLKCHGNDFHDMNIYSWMGGCTSKGALVLE